MFEYPATLPEDLGDAPPPGEQHALLPEIDAPLGLDPVDIVPTIAHSLASTGLNFRTTAGRLAAEAGRPDTDVEPWVAEEKRAVQIPEEPTEL